MADFIYFFQELNIPFWVYIASSAFILLFVLFILWFVHTRIFKFRLRKIINAKDEQQMMEAIGAFERHYPAKKLLFYSKRMER